MSLNSHLEKSLDVYLQQFPWNELFDLAPSQSTSSSTQETYPSSYTLKSPPPREYPIPFSSPSESNTLHSSNSNHQNWQYSSNVTNNSSSPENWSNCLKQFINNQSEPFERSLQKHNIDLPSLGSEKPYCVEHENDAQVGTGISSTDRPQACTSTAKRKRSDSHLSFGSSQSSTAYRDCKVFECTLDPECSEKFSRIEHLTRHERKHTKVKPFKCHCGKEFGRLDNWRKHKKSVHKSSDVENAQTEKILARVQKKLQRLDKLRTPTIVRLTEEEWGTEVKRVKRYHQAKLGRPKGKTKSHEVSLPMLIPESPQPKVPGTDFPHSSLHNFEKALGGFEIPAPTYSNFSLDDLDNVTDLTNYSFDGGATNSEFTPQGTSSTLSDCSTSSFPTPISINRVLPFQNEPPNFSPQFSDLQTGEAYPPSLLGPFHFLSTLLNPTSF